MEGLERSPHGYWTTVPWIAPWKEPPALANTVVSLFYYAWVLDPGFFEGGKAPRPAVGPGSLPALAAGVAAAGLLAGGIGADWLLAAMDAARLLP